MAFKHNIPLPALVLVLVAAAIVGLVVLHRPPEEDQIRQAVDRYVATLGPVKQMEIHGTVADILLAEKGRLIYAEFEKKGDSWVFARDLAAEFTQAMKDPHTQQEMVRRLGDKISQRFQSSVKLDPGIDNEYGLARDADTGKLLGRCLLRFAYPKVNGVQKRGEYLEYFGWMDGRWQSLGPGSLYDVVGR